MSERVDEERGSRIIAIEGRLSTNERHSVGNSLTAAFKDVNVLILDCSNLSHLDMDAESVLLRMMEAARTFSKKLAVVGLNGQPLRQLTRTGLVDHLDCYGSVDEALDALAPTPS